jgi:hypothetical protein
MMAPDLTTPAGTLVIGLTLMGELKFFTLLERVI